jgi:hypothetical protein
MNKKVIQVTKEELQQIIKEGVARLHRQAIIENRIKQINEELAAINSVNEGDIMGKEEYEILEAYLETALWTEEEEIGPASISDISDESREKANQDVLTFMSKAGSLINALEPSQIGHDLWLTRNGHGTGFWDRGLDEVGDKLTEIAKEMGSKYLYRGDDGKIYID